MCVYCVTGDQFFRYDPPWRFQQLPPYVPAPVYPGPFTPWPLDKLKDYLEVLERIKALEDKLGCPCEPNKADYIGMFRERIAALEKKVGEKTT